MRLWDWATVMLVSLLTSLAGAEMELSGLDGSSFMVFTYHDFRARAFGFPSVLGIVDFHRPAVEEKRMVKRSETPKLGRTSDRRPGTY